VCERERVCVCGYDGFVCITIDMCECECVCERESVCVDMMALFVLHSICVSVCERENESV